MRRYGDCCILALNCIAAASVHIAEICERDSMHGGRV